MKRVSAIVGHNQFWHSISLRSKVIFMYLSKKKRLGIDFEFYECLFLYYFSCKYTSFKYYLNKS